MCGRFSQHYTWQEVHAFTAPLTLHGPALNLEPRYNIAPTQQVGVLVPTESGGFTYERMRWWLVPFFWKKALREVPSTFNARAETVDTAPMFRDAFRRRRCLIPPSGFFEWTGPKDDRKPWYISTKDGGLLAFAGLHDRWTDPHKGEEVRSCTIIVCPANAFMAEVHDRMPVILPKEAWAAWLAEPQKDVLAPAEGDALQRWPVTPKMNSSRYEAPDAINRIAP